MKQEISGKDIEKFAHTEKRLCPSIARDFDIVALSQMEPSKQLKTPFCYRSPTVGYSPNIDAKKISAVLLSGKSTKPLAVLTDMSLGVPRRQMIGKRGLGAWGSEPGRELEKRQSLIAPPGFTTKE